ncbi:MAG: FHA domain-containing protein [Sulfurovum sp.]|nr:MAG: FHA domain-containing protein [Sulfurovum sp.]
MKPSHHLYTHPFYITDLDSTNGTYINGERLVANTPTNLNVGDELTIANAQFKYRRI